MDWGQGERGWPAGSVAIRFIADTHLALPQFGRKPVIIVSSAVFVVGALVLAAAPTVAILIIGRVVSTPPWHSK